MSDVVEQFPRLPYDLMEYALRRLKSAPAGAEMEAACREAWDQLRADGPAGTEGAVPSEVTFDDFRRAFEATFHRYPDLRSRPAA